MGKSGILVSQPSPLGKGDRVSGARVLSQTAHLRRSFPLSFMPLEPYPARSARHLPHAGKAVSVVILHVSCIRFDDARKPAFSYRSLPHWGRGTALAVDRVLSLIVDLRCISSLSFIPLVPYPARSARYLPLEGKALFRKYRYPHPTSAPSGRLLSEEGGRMPASPIANPFPASSSRNLPLFCGTI